MNSKQLASWGRYPAFPQNPEACHWRSDLSRQLHHMQDTHGSTLAFGNGRSYGDSCLAASDHVLQLRTLDRFIEADWNTGRVIVEAGVTLQEILQQSLPRGWFLPVTPGTQFVTVGGAIANDVHGKNHHVRGTFGRHVAQFALLRSDRGLLTCTPQENAELFAATIGGLGLTGIIAWAEMQLMPVRSSHVVTTSQRFDSLAEFFALSDELDPQHEYSVSWIDCASRGNALGRGIFTAGDHAGDGGLALQQRRPLSLPLTPPVSAINTLSLRTFNSVYYRVHAAGRQQGRSHYQPFFYPLDRILHWNRLYGPRGFQQFQCVIPENNAADAIAELLDCIAASGSGSFLAVLKRCGDAVSPGLMSFPLPGVSLALDFAQNTGTRALLEKLDRITTVAHGRLYPAKDAHMRGEDFRRAYPGWQKVDALRDPALASRFWNRVTRS